MITDSSSPYCLTRLRELIQPANVGSALHSYDERVNPQMRIASGPLPELRCLTNIGPSVHSRCGRCKSDGKDYGLYHGYIISESHDYIDKNRHAGVWTRRVVSPRGPLDDYYPRI